MGSSDSHPSDRRLRRRPSLLERAGRDAGDEFAHSMLAPLERENGTRRASARSGGRPRRKGLWLVLVLAGGVAALAGMRIAGDGIPARAAASGSGAAVAPGTDAPAAAGPVAPAAAAGGNAAARIERSGAPAAPTIPAPSAAAVSSGVPGVHAATAAASASIAPAARPSREPVRAAPGTLAGAGAVERRPTEATQDEAPSATSRDGGAPLAGSAARTAAKGPALAQPARSDQRRPKDDADTELVAAIIARLDRRGAEPTGAARAVNGSADPGPPALADRIRACDDVADLVNARRCRSKACDGRWGKAAACPSSSAPGPRPTEDAGLGG